MEKMKLFYFGWSMGRCRTEAGSLIEDGVPVTANFGSRSGENLDVQSIFRSTKRDGPDVHGVLG